MNSSNTIRSSTIQLVRCYAMLVIGAGPSYFCLVGPNMGLESPAGWIDTTMRTKRGWLVTA